MNNVAPSAPHIHRQRSVAMVMREVCYALLPGLLVAVYLFGSGVIMQCLLACLAAVGSEALILKLRQRPISFYLQDCSALLTGLLIGLTVSPLTPWWMTVTAAVFAIVIAKHLFGGIGHNLFNPAMAGYVFILLCFPAAMVIWPDVTLPAPGWSVTIETIFLGNSPPDAITGATPLGWLRTELTGMAMLSELQSSPLLGLFGGRGWEWLATAWLLGGSWLLFRGIIRWPIPVAVLMGCLVPALLFHAFDPDTYISPVLHLFSGGLMLGAFFIATDPVSAATSVRGRLIYGAGIGLLVYLIRTFGNYPDGVAFGVLLMNALVPWIDHYTRPRVLGESPTGNGND